MRRTFRFQTTLKLVIAILALIGQAAVASISAAPDEAGAAAHVERSGVSLHHAHNEATCVVCRVLSIHGRVAAQPAVPAVAATLHAAPKSVLSFRHDQLTLPDNLSRAPPEIA